MAGPGLAGWEGPLRWGGPFSSGGYVFTSRLEFVRSEIKRLTAGWRAAPTVSVVPSAAHLPVDVPAGTRGMLHRGRTVYIVADQPLRMVSRTLAHETTHLGIRTMLGARKWGSFMAGILSGIRAGDPILGQLHAQVRSVYVDDFGAPCLTPNLEADEVASALAERAVNLATGRIEIADATKKRAILAAGQIARDVLYADVPVCSAQLEAMLLAAQDQLRHGGPLWGIGHRLRHWYAGVMVKPADRYKPPMSMEESQRLQDAAKRHDDGIQDAKVLFSMAAIVVFGLFVVGCLVIGILQALRII